MSREKCALCFDTVNRQDQRPCRIRHERGAAIVGEHLQDRQYRLEKELTRSLTLAALHAGFRATVSLPTSSPWPFKIAATPERGGMRPSDDTAWRMAYSIKDSLSSLRTNTNSPSERFQQLRVGSAAPRRKSCSPCAIALAWSHSRARHNWNIGSWLSQRPGMR
jgi:hypothetical protein